VLIVGLLLVLACANNWAKFNDFMIKYDKHYESLEETEYRYKVFQANIARIEIQNKEHIAAGGEAVFGVNGFTDMTPEEFERRLMKNLPHREPQVDPNVVFEMPNGDIDWRTYSYTVVTAVKDQGQCGSCWAHSADEATESFNALYKTKTTATVLSVQQCTACTYDYNGCNGGWPHDAYVYAIEDRDGIVTDASYPYDIAQAGNCKFTGNVTNPSTDIKTYVSPLKGQLQTALVQGPISVCVAAEQWQTYTGGVLSVCPGQVDHCVQAVGFNTTAPTPYWIVRNSWGTSWGEQGYIWLSMATNNGDICHIQEYMTYPTF